MSPAPANLEAPLEIVEPLCAIFRRKLKAEGAKYTPERAHVLDAIIRIDGLFEADALLERLRKEGRRVSKATVYRTIKLMLEAGIIQRVLVDGEQAHYQLVYGKTPGDLLVRIDEGRVEEILVPGLADICRNICKARGLTLKGHRLQIFASA
ncbi:MAG: transcriptional repressor [Phycisphaeraceae bacterium]|nr:transcriptional repressor [Phycisphaeraceae bacterium]MCW5753256.1 transcriptional repressor [Phycisphaeraceae bacterium]